MNSSHTSIQTKTISNFIHKLATYQGRCSQHTPFEKLVQLFPNLDLGDNFCCLCSVNWDTKCVDPQFSL